MDAEALLTIAIHQSQNATHHVLAGRALVRTRSQQWDAAIADAEEVLAALLSHMHTLILFYIKSIKIQPSVIGYIAKFVALVGNGETRLGHRVFDIALERFHSSRVTIHLLIKVCSTCF